MTYETQVLLSIDCEFTHPSPRVGSLMCMGIAACSVSWGHWNRQGEPPGKPIYGSKVQTFDALLRPKEGALITPWVSENQGDLYQQCREEGDDPADARRYLINFLKGLRTKYDTDMLIPVGWCIGSDYAYLLDLLGEDCDLVHYSCRDVAGILTGITGKYNPPDDKLNKFLGVKENQNPHDALSDAVYQLDLVKGALLRAWQQADLFNKSAINVSDAQTVGLLQRL